MERTVSYLGFLLFWMALLQSGSASVRVRLIVNGTNSSSEGRVEVLYRGVWGTICDDWWSLDNAHVVCRMLGFARASMNKRFGPGTGTIWLDDVDCRGTETSIDKCSHSGWGIHNCIHREDIGIVCTNEQPNITARLANSSFPHAGGVLIRYYGTWKPLCDGYWSIQDAHVVCRMVNYTDGAAFALRGFQSTTGIAWDTWISCRGTETSIDKCKLWHWGEKRCGSDNRAGVVCRSKGQAADTAVRLVNGTTPSKGRLEIRYFGVWGTVCDDYWGISNAHVVCHMLNYSKALTTSTARSPGNLPILLDDVLCSGFEDSLENCRKRQWGQHNCDHHEDVEVTCKQGPRAYPNISVRLVNNSLAYAGLLEVRYYGVWKPVCDNWYWTIRDAHVACRMLNYSQGAVFPVGGYQGSIGDAWVTSISCRGTETSLGKCTLLYVKQMNCGHHRKAGVVCRVPGQDSNMAVRLVDGSSPNQGRLEVRYYGVWGTVCDDYWDIADAHVVCRMLNYSKASWTGTTRVRGRGPILLDSVYCSGYENSLESCWNQGWGLHDCSHFEDVGVTCENRTKVEIPDVAVRLINDTIPNRGRVEVRYYGIWGTVCDDRWGLADAHVVCRMLNYSKASWAGTAEVSGSGPIALDEVQCRGNEKSIDYCPKAKLGWHNCWHGEDSGVQCEMLSKDELEVTVRLIGTDYNHMGIVEVQYNGTWIPVCDDTWDISDAHVVCRMLGYEGALLGIKGYRVRKEVGPWMGNVECSGDEKLISECYHRGWTNKWCPGNFYAGLMCNLTEDLQVRVRLEEGSSPNSGRVAIRYGSIWGTVCRDELDTNSAEVICRMLGYPGVHYIYNFKPGSGAIWLMNLECSGTEKSIGECGHGWGNRTTCGHDNDAAIMCKKVGAPQFEISGSIAIAETTVEISFKEPQKSSYYQIAVEKRSREKNYQSDGQTVPSVFMDDASVTMATNKFNNSYITAQIPGNTSSLTIGDGQCYNGSYNKPLEPGCRYRVYVRSVMTTAEKTSIYSDTAFVAFTTKLEAKANKATSGRQVGGTNYKAAVIGLSVFVFLLLLLGIGYYGWSYLREKRTSQTTSKTNQSDNSLEMETREKELSTPHYQPLSYPELGHSQDVSTANEQSTPHYQPPSYAARGNTDGGQDNRFPATGNETANPHYQHLSHPATQGNTEHEISSPHYQPLNYPAVKDEKKDRANEMLKKMYRKKDKSSAPEQNEPSNSNNQSSYFPQDFGGIENRVYDLSGL